MNDFDVIDRLHAARDAHLAAAPVPTLRSTHLDVTTHAVPRPRGGRLAVAASVVAIAGAGTAVAIAALPSGTRHAASITPGAPRLTASTSVAPAAADGSCMPQQLPPAHVVSDATDGRQTTPAGEPLWDHPDAAFYASLPDDPAALTSTLRQDARAEENYRVSTGDDRYDPSTLTTSNLDYLFVNYLSGFLTDSAFPARLDRPVADALAQLARTPDANVQAVHVDEGTGGCTGTGYTSRAEDQTSLPPLVFAADGTFLGVHYRR